MRGMEGLIRATPPSELFRILHTKMKNTLELENVLGMSTAGGVTGKKVMPVLIVFYFNETYIHVCARENVCNESKFASLSSSATIEQGCLMLLKQIVN